MNQVAPALDWFRRGLAGYLTPGSVVFRARRVRTVRSPASLSIRFAQRRARTDVATEMQPHGLRSGLTSNLFR